MQRLVPALLVCAVLQPALAAGAIDPALLGTWKLQWQRADYFWTVRNDGVYRLHGLGGTHQHGRLEAADGRFSLKSPFWADTGTYKLNDADTWTVTGQLGPPVSGSELGRPRQRSPGSQAKVPAGCSPPVRPRACSWLRSARTRTRGIRNAAPTNRSSMVSTR